MGYVETRAANIGTVVQAEVRGKMHEATIARMPFVEQRYYKE